MPWWGKRRGRTTKRRSRRVSPLSGPSAWATVAVLLWLTTCFIKLHYARVLIFDLLVGAALAFMIVARTLSRGRVGVKAPPWECRAQPLFYVAMGLLLWSGALSALNANNLKGWGLEMAAFIYLSLMMVALDMFSARRPDRFLRLGGWSFAAICAFCGLIAASYLLGAPQIDWFYEVNIRHEVTHKFVGTARYPNQWCGLFLCFFPLLLALVFEQRPTWQRSLAAVCALLGCFTIPASGSRSGMFLMVAELLGFTILYLVISRNGRVLARLFGLLAFGALFGMAWWTWSEQMGDSPIFQRSLSAFDLIGQGKVSDGWREYNWNAALTEYRKHPLIGIGWGTFQHLYDKHEVHSSYLSILAETGLLGFVAYVTMLGLAMLQCCRALLVTALRGKADPLLIAQFISLIAALIFGIYHNTTRQRFIWVVVFFGMVYGEHVLMTCRAQRTEARFKPPASSRS